jgi:hypothetical protein
MGRRPGSPGQGKRPDSRPGTQAPRCTDTRVSDARTGDGQRPAAPDPVPAASHGSAPGRRRRGRPGRRGAGGRRPCRGRSRWRARWRQGRPGRGARGRRGRRRRRRGDREHREHRDERDAGAGGVWSVHGGQAHRHPSHASGTVAPDGNELSPACYPETTSTSAGVADAQCRVQGTTVTVLGQPPINARAEPIAGSDLFRGALARTRCLVPATGLLEFGPLLCAARNHGRTWSAGEPYGQAQSAAEAVAVGAVEKVEVPRSEDREANRDLLGAPPGRRPPAAPGHPRCRAAYASTATRSWPTRHGSSSA